MAPKSRHLIRCLLVLLVVAFLVPFVRGQSGVQYVYDQLGRLVGVIDPSGNAAAYSYDSVGNLLSITRYGASQVSVLGFSPASGPVGTVVTLNGTGFSSTPTDDAVTFNGSSASISSASVNQIVTSVPSGASTGTITVTTPNGTFTTSAQFTVTTSGGPPSISGFSPTSGVAGDTLTISGANFYTSAGNNRLRINVTNQPISSTTNTQITSTIAASTGSGRIAVVTPSGSATSTQDFYLPFGSHPASAIGYTGRISAGGSQPVSLSGQIGLLLFDAVPGQEASLQITGTTFSTCTIYIFAPDTTQLSSGSCSANSDLPYITLPMAGTYTIGIDPGGASGGVTVGLDTTPGAVPPPARPQPSVIDYTNTLSNHLAGLFLMNEGTGSADENLADTQTAAFAGTTPPEWNTTDPSLLFNGGSSLNSYVNAGADSSFDQLTTSQMTVVAKVYVGAVAAAGIAEKNDSNSIDSGFAFGWDSTGALHLTVEKSGSDMRAATANGVITSGQWIQVAFTWDGTVGTASAAHFYLNGVEQSKASSSDGSGTVGYKNATNKPFRIGNASFDPQSGSLNGKMAYLAVYKGRVLTAAELAELDTDFPIDTSDVTGSITENGSSVPVTTTNAGQNVQLTFNGVLEQEATIQVTNNTIGAVTVSLLSEDGTSAASVSSSSSSFTVPAALLTSTSLYRVYVHPTAGGDGNITLALTTQGGVGSIPSRPTGSVVDSGNPLSTDLVGLFTMNEGSGSTDENLVDAQTAAFSGTSLPTWNTSDPSIVFNGGGSLHSYLDAGTDLAFDQLPTSQITIVAKVYVNTVAAGGVAEKNDNNATDSGFVFGWDSNGALHLTIEKSSSNMRVYTANGVITSGQWIQVAFTWDGTIGTSSAAHFYLNGVEQGKASSSDGSGTLGYANATNKPFRLGNAGFDPQAGSLNGKMAYLAVYKGRILTTAEMAQLDANLPIQ